MEFETVASLCLVLDGDICIGHLVHLTIEKRHFDFYAIFTGTFEPRAQTLGTN